MDPVTAAGLALAVIPLLISAFENYEVTLQPFVTYCRHVREVQRFTDRLDTQRAIFSNECQLLMLSLGENMNDVVKDPNHPFRRDELLSNRLKDMLGSSYKTCVSTLNLINETLKKITEETKDFRYLLEVNKREKTAFSLFRQKLKISFSKTRLNDIVGELRVYNDDLCKLSRQIRELAANTSQELPSAEISSNSISHLKTSRQASERLYDVLASKWSCDDHVEHVASMSLKVDEQCRNASSKVRFKLALTCNHAVAGPSEPLWLAIESGPGISASPQKVSIEEDSAVLETTLKKMGATGRSVRFSLPSIAPATSVTTVLPGNIPSVLGPQLNLYGVGKLCRYFHEHVKLQVANDPCVGFLERTTTFRHFIYPMKPSLEPKPAKTSSRTLSLKQILHQAAEERRQEDWAKKLQLAKLLSLAVLYFSSEWIPDSWSSNDVYFYDTEGVASQPTPFNSPFTNVPLSSSKTSRFRAGNNHSASLATNPTLFNLGVVLIELGYDAPFENLGAKPSDATENQSTSRQVQDFIMARRLGESVHRQLNMTYGRLVEKCLNCNFGVATKLEDSELQSAVLFHVVKELDTCLKQWNDFNALISFPASVH